MADKNQNIKKALYTNDQEPGAIDPDDTTQSMPHDENEGMHDMINDQHIKTTYNLKKTTL